MFGRNVKVFFVKNFEKVQNGEKVQTVLNLINLYKIIKK